MLAHFIRLIALVLLLGVLMFRPFLPGEYDALAVTLSFMAQLIGFAGLLLVPVGALWLVVELRAQGRAAQRGRGATLALVALIVATLVALAASLPAFGGFVFSLGLGWLALWGVCLWRLWGARRRLRQTDNPGFNPAPLYLLVVPLALVGLRLGFIDRAIAYSRAEVIRNSAPLIADIEAFYARHGRYPLALASVWKDYKPNIIGVAHYQYALSGGAYNVIFEQLAADLATREFVVYHPLDRQVINSHDSWYLAPEFAGVDVARGHYAVHPAEAPHWKYFWFD